MKIYTDETNHVDVQVSEGKKWYSYTLPKDKGLYRISGDTVNKVVVKADFSYEGISSYPSSRSIIPHSTIEASFKGSDTSNVTEMGNMFNDCSGLTSLDVSNFDTSNVTRMNYMFSNCSNLTSLYVSNFDTSKVTNMSYMFRYCNGLTSLDLSKLDTSKVTDMSSMFEHCSNLTSLDISDWNMSNVTSMNKMFRSCASLTSIRMVGCSLNTVKTIQNQLKEDNITGVTIVTA